MDNKTTEQLNKEIQRTIEKAKEEVRGRELTPSRIRVNVEIETKEGRNIYKEGSAIEITPATKK